MKIVDSFLFSEIFEKELLLLKFILEDCCIDEWILLENAYSFQGDFKGLQAKQLMDSDERFKPFLHKVNVIATEMQPPKLDYFNTEDAEAFKIERWQRNRAYDYFINNYNDEDYLLVSDVDEMLDFSSKSRREEFFEVIASNKSGFIEVPTKRYIYDFDNEYAIMLKLTLATKAFMLHHHMQCDMIRQRTKLDNSNFFKHEWKQIIGFEYSSCFPITHIMQKLQTNSHMGFTKEELQASLDNNVRIQKKSLEPITKKSQKFFYNRVMLNNENSPTYVNENFEKFKTGNININYVANRKKNFPKIFSLQAGVKRKLGNAFVLMKNKLK